MARGRGGGGQQNQGGNINATIGRMATDRAFRQEILEKMQTAGVLNQPIIIDLPCEDWQILIRAGSQSEAVTKHAEKCPSCHQVKEVTENPLAGVGGKLGEIGRRLFSGNQGGQGSGSPLSDAIGEWLRERKNRRQQPPTQNQP